MALLDLESRDEIPALLDLMGLNKRGVEVGVSEGVFSETILRGSKMQWLFGVDVWCAERLWDGEFSTWAEYQVAVNRLRPFGLRSILMKMLSVEAATVFPDDWFDFVYLDAGHQSEKIDADIRAWAPKVKPGGILSGHDYDALAPGVRQAVDEFVLREGLELTVTALDSTEDGFETHSWLIQRPPICLD